MGIDPVTHKPKNDALVPRDGNQSKTAANLSHMALWESARLEAEARLARESKLRSSLSSFTSPSSSSSASHPVLRPWNNNNNNNGGWLKSTDQNDLESPKSTLTLSENTQPIIMPMIEFVGTSSGSCDAAEMVKAEGDHHQREWNNNRSNGFENSLSYELTISNMEANWASQEPLLRIGTAGDDDAVAAEDQGFTNLLLNTNSDDRSLSEEDGGGGGILCEDNKNYWNSILNLVNSDSPSHSPMF